MRRRCASAPARCSAPRTECRATRSTTGSQARDKGDADGYAGLARAARGATNEAGLDDGGATAPSMDIEEVA